jgi:hypothetical protein
MDDPNAAIRYMIQVFMGSIRRPVIDNDQLKIGKGLIQDALKGLR